MNQDNIIVPRFGIVDIWNTVETVEAEAENMYSY